MSVSVKVDGLMVLTGAAVAGVTVLWLQRGELLKKIDPTSTDNVAYQGAAAAGDAVGIPDTDSRGVALDDYVFAAIDQVNPFNESDVYSDYVIWGKPITNP